MLYWKERGDKSNTWDSKFVQHVKRQWNFYTGLTEINNEPVLIDDKSEKNVDENETISKIKDVLEIKKDQHKIRGGLKQMQKDPYEWFADKKIRL